MKKQLIAAAAAALIFGSLSLGYGAEHMQPPGSFATQMAKALDLTSDQQSQIKAILSAQREADASLLQQQGDLRQQLRNAEWATSYDADTVLALATTLGQVEADLTVSRTKAMFQVNSLLTSTQRALAQKLAPEASGRPGPPPSF